MLSPLNIFKTFLQLIDVIAKKIVGLFLSAMPLLPKLMSGEIDVSKIDVAQLNSHLEKRKAAASVLSLIFPIALPGLWSPMQ